MRTWGVLRLDFALVLILGATTPPTAVEARAWPDEVASIDSYELDPTSLDRADVTTY
ncbi:MAG: hypothetical protein HYY16_03330 [Planctomycetes bacterium]|nr:hypothetical protein [Planctomycetota bacterium]